MARNRAKNGRRKLGSVVQRLPVLLPDHQLLAFARQNAALAKTIAEHEAETKELAAARKEELKTLKKESSQLSFIVRTGAEPRDVVVDCWANYDDGRYEETRQDTGELVVERDLKPEERQTSMTLATTESNPDEPPHQPEAA